MPKRSRCKLLLDEMLPKRQLVPRVNHYHNVRHVAHDYRLSGITDVEVVKLAKKEKRIVVTNNTRHFRKLGLKFAVEIIGVDQGMGLEEIDKKLLAKLRSWKQKKGIKYTKID